MMTSLPRPLVARSAFGIRLRARVEEWVATEPGGRMGASVGAAGGDRVLVGVGVDMVDTTELADLIETSGRSFMDLCWTPSEQVYCAGSIPSLAARWAAKEATMKALGRGIGVIDPIDIEVVSIEGEPPALRLYGSAETIARERRMSHLAVSLTHEGTFAIAFVLAMGAAANPTHMPRQTHRQAPAGVP